ncbi:Dyp-type peroxidase [Nocardioides rubriscoriae]|uniref:Dyp-type peroxidase n=1 Tax=Nocardioides rubriscoriae TaxID=642762 RepID=UPI0011DFC5C0|nr:Dyp-type peroxidase [Nocardioides rubriscoriae]
MTQRDLGILPNTVSRSPQSETALVFGTLAAGLDQATAQQWLTTLQGHVEEAEHGTGAGEPDITMVVAFGAPFFARFPEHAANTPKGLLAPPNLPPMQIPAITADVVLHVTFTNESSLADFLKKLWATRPVLASMEVERGYARRDNREVFGQLDGLRNLSSPQRRTTTRIDLDVLPEEPTWLAGGCYGAYLKIEQNIDAWAAMGPEVHEQVIGRREADGSRLDLPAGSDPKTEGDFADPDCPMGTAHLRKTGPRGPVNDKTLIFRRGTPYAEEENGAMHFGLQFVSYQADLDDFDVVLNRWMLNTDFPARGAGQDALVANGLLTFLKGGFFVVVPHDDRFPAAGFFDPAPAGGNHRVGRIHIRKSVTDVNGNPVNAELGGFVFQMFDPATGYPIGEPATTTASGHAVLEGAPLNKPVLVREVATTRFEPHPDDEVTLTDRNYVHEVVNRLLAAASPYGG